MFRGGFRRKRGLFYTSSIFVWLGRVKWFGELMYCLQENWLPAGLSLHIIINERHQRVRGEPNDRRKLNKYLQLFSFGYFF